MNELQKYVAESPLYSDTWKERCDSIGLQLLPQFRVNDWNILERDEVLSDPPLELLWLTEPPRHKRLHLKVKCKALNLRVQQPNLGRNP